MISSLMFLNVHLIIMANTASAGNYLSTCVKRTICVWVEEKKTTAGITRNNAGDRSVLNLLVLNKACNLIKLAKTVLPEW